ncbi:MAG TPA: PilN domain-containing protein, partial [Steroidobacteraceae bacterium]
ALLAELETASRDSAEIALLSVEPDHAKHYLRITGESRDLPRILAYVQRLQTSSLLRYPMLESHDLKTDDPQHPVRFAMTAEWEERP